VGIDDDIFYLDRLKHIYHTPDERSAIRVMCRRVLTSLNLSDPPISLRPICKRFNLKVVYNNKAKKEDSQLKLVSNGFEIEISRLKNWRRNRFTIAHELAHLIILRSVGTPEGKLSKEQYQRVETLCDIGASELLISEDVLKAQLLIHGLGSEGIKQLYDKFMVSYDALLLKLSEILNCNIMVWRKYARHENEQKEFRVFKHFPKYRYAEKLTWLPNGCTAKHIVPTPFELYSSKNNVLVMRDFKILINDKMVSCGAISFPLPSSRTLNNNLPIFDDLEVMDEAIYDDSHILLVFSDISKLEQVTHDYLKIQ